MLDRWWCQRFAHGGCGFEWRPTLNEREEASRIEHVVLESRLACAALLTASAYGLEAWCFVAPTDCGLGLFARSELVQGQAITSYEGPRLPLELIVKGEFVLAVPGQEVAIDAAYENVTYNLRADCPMSAAMRANHSRRPNAALEHWPTRGDELDRLVLVARESIPAGAEVRFDYERGGRSGSYWGRHAPPETGWRHYRRQPPPPTCDEPIVDYLPRLLASRDPGHHSADSPTPPPPRLLPEKPFPLAWAGRRGGDEVLRHLIEQVQPTGWLQECARCGEGKTRLWQLVATHLPGRSPQECQARWRSLHAEQRER